MALRADISQRDDWYLGEDKALQFVIWTDKGKTARQDITGWTFTYDFYANGEEAFSATSGDGITITDAAEGELTVAVAAEDTAALTDLSNLHHVLRRSDAGNEAVLSIGDVILNDPAGA